MSQLTSARRSAAAALDVSKALIGTTKKSMLTRSLVWFSRNDRHVYEGGFRRLTMYFSTVDFVISIPSLRISPRILGEPHRGLAVDIQRIRFRTSLAMGGQKGAWHMSIAF